MKVRIVNEGKHANFTRITNAETGEDLSYLRLSEVSIRVGDGLPTAILTANLPVIDIVADAQIRHVCPVCGRPEE